MVYIKTISEEMQEKLNRPGVTEAIYEMVDNDEDERVVDGLVVRRLTDTEDDDE